MASTDSYYEFLYFPGDGSVYSGWTIRDTGTFYVGQGETDITGAMTQVTNEVQYAVDLADYYYGYGYDGSAYEDGVMWLTGYAPPTGFTAGFDPYIYGQINAFETALAADWLVR
jgi:hypothetical protein